MIKNNLELLLFLKISFTRGLLSTWDCLTSFTKDPSQNMKWPLLIAPWTLYSTTYPCNDSACSFDVIQPCASARRTFIWFFYSDCWLVSNVKSHHHKKTSQESSGHWRRYLVINNEDLLCLTWTGNNINIVEIYLQDLYSRGTVFIGIIQLLNKYNKIQYKFFVWLFMRLWSCINGHRLINHLYLKGRMR